MRRSLPFAALGLALFAACSDSIPTPTYTGPYPDVVIVLVDTLRADFVELDQAGGTPFLAQIARESVVFADASSPAPWTLPSVASLITGRHIAEHGVFREDRVIPKSMRTLAERLLDRGFETRAVYRNAFAGPMSELDRGYAQSARSELEIGGEELLPLLAKPDGSSDSRPLLLYVHNAEPHDPQNTPANKSRLLGGEEREFLAWYRKTIKRYRAMTRRGYQNEHSAEGLDFDAEQSALLAPLIERQAEAFRIYARAVKESDERIESIVEELRNRGRWEQTLFIVLSDHGEEMGEHGGWLHDQSLYQELVHVPLIVRFPNGRFGGTTIEEPASLIDLLPTILGHLDLDQEEDELDGQDWWSVLAGKAIASDGPRVVSMRINDRKRFRPWERSRGDFNIAVRDGRWKGIWNRDLDRLELYDIAGDPGELNDRAGEQPERAAELLALAREAWQRMKLRSRVAEGDGLEGLDQGALENLEDLGYLGDG